MLHSKKLYLYKETNNKKQKQHILLQLMEHRIQKMFQLKKINALETEWPTFQKVMNQTESSTVIKQF